MKKRFLCLLLILVMTLSLLPTAVLAEDGSSENKTFANLKAGETYYFDLSGVGIPGDVDERLPDKSLCYVPFTYAGKLEDVYRVKRMEAGLVDELGSWPLFVAGVEVSKVSWNALNEKGLIYGESYTNNGVDYTLRAPSGNARNNEWDAMLSQKCINRVYLNTWVQETASDDMAFCRNSSLSSGLPMPRDSSDIYYRPVLQPKDWEGKPLHVVTLVVNGTNYKVITAEDTITLPSINGLLSDPDDDLLYGYYWYNAKTSKYYRSSSQIPVTDGMTLEAVENSGIKITDKNGKDYLLTGDDNKLDLDDGGHVYYNPILLRLTLKDANLQGIEYDGTLILLLDGRNSIAAKGDADAICARDLDIRSSSTNDGILTISAEKGLAYRSIGNNTSYSQSRSEQPISGERKNPHITMPASALKEFEKFNFYGGTLTLIGNGVDTLAECLRYGDIAKGTTVKIVGTNGREEIIAPEDGQKITAEDWYERMSLVEDIAKVYLIAEGATLPPEEDPKDPDDKDPDDKDPDDEDPKESSMEGVVAGAMALLASGDDNPFRDVRAIDWFYDDVMYAYDRGLINGTAYDKFSPKDSFTRGMLLTILARHDGVNTKGTPWYQAGCDWAARNGISDGENPEEAISREEFALILYRYAQYLGKQALDRADLSRYTDASSVSDAALSAVQWTVAEAILRGDNFRLNPQDGTTRAEAAAMLHRFFTR